MESNCAPGYHVEFLPHLQGGEACHPWKMGWSHHEGRGCSLEASVQAPGWRALEPLLALGQIGPWVHSRVARLMTMATVMSVVAWHVCRTVLAAARWGRGDFLTRAEAPDLQGA